MNVVFPSFCIVVAGAAGFIMEPQLEGVLIPQKPSVAQNTPAPEPLPVAPTPPPAPKHRPTTTASLPDKPAISKESLQTKPAPAPESNPVAKVSEEQAHKNEVNTILGNLEEETPPAPLPGGGDIGGANGDEAKNKAIIALMQDSIRNRDINEFKYDQVIGWKAAGMETVDGESYQIGLAAARADTIFGVKNLEAKALIKNGKIVKWVWAKSQLEIK